MNRVIVKSIHGAFDYVMKHYYPYGIAAEAAEQGALTDTYAVKKFTEFFIPESWKN